VIADDFISLRSDGTFVWTSRTGRQWTASELFRETLKLNLTPGDEAAVFEIVDKLNRLQRRQPKLHSFV